MADKARSTTLNEIEVPPSASERRQQRRRKEDLDAGAMEWMNWLVRSKAKLAAIVALIGGVCGFAVRDLGFKVSSPTQELAQVERRAIARDSSQDKTHDQTNARVTVVENGLGEIKSEVHDVRMILCAYIRMQRSPLVDQCATRRAP